MPGELNTTASNIQMTIGVMTFGVALGQLFGGPISDTMGRKMPLIVGNLLCVISSIICAYAPSIGNTITRPISTRLNRICRG